MARAGRPARCLASPHSYQLTDRPPSAPDLPTNDISFLNQPDSSSYDTGYSTSDSVSSDSIEIRPDPEPAPPRKHHRSRDAFAEIVSKYKYDPRSALSHRHECRPPSRRSTRSPRLDRPTSRSRHRHRRPSPEMAHVPIKRPANPRLPSPPRQYRHANPPSISTTQSLLVNGRTAKITPSEHSAYSLQHRHHVLPPQRPSFEPPLVQISPKPPHSGNPSANLSGASLAQLSAQRAISGVVMDTTRAAWHLQTTRPTPDTRVRPATAGPRQLARVAAPLRPMPTAPGLLYSHPQSLASFDIAPPETLPSARSSHVASPARPAFLSQVLRQQPSRPSSAHQPAVPHYHRSLSAHPCHVSFGSANQHDSPPRTVATSAGPSPAMGPLPVEPGLRAQVDEFGYTQLDPDAMCITTAGDEGWSAEHDVSAGDEPRRGAPGAFDAPVELILPWQSEGARWPTDGVDGVVCSGRSGVSGESATAINPPPILLAGPFDERSTVRGGVDAALAYSPPTLFGADELGVPSSAQDDGQLVLGDAATFLAGEIGQAPSGVGEIESDQFARDMRGWWHRSKP